jgi:hypothetical protein
LSAFSVLPAMVASEDDFLGDSSGVARLDVLLFKDCLAV